MEMNTVNNLQVAQNISIYTMNYYPSQKLRTKDLQHCFLTYQFHNILSSSNLYYFNYNQISFVMGSELCTKTDTHQIDILERPVEKPTKEYNPEVEEHQGQQNPGQLPVIDEQIGNQPYLKSFRSDHRQLRIASGSKINNKLKVANSDIGYTGQEPYSPNIYFRRQLKEHELTMIKMKEKVISHKERASRAVQKQLDDLRTSGEQDKDREKQLEEHLKTYEKEIGDLKNTIEQIKKGTNVR